jgi:hypothetical protein
LSGVAELDNIAIVNLSRSKIMPDKLSQTKLKGIIDWCKAIINPNHIQVCWKPQQCNKVADSLMEYVKSNKMDIFDTDLDLKLYHITWDLMFGASRPYLSNSDNTSYGRQLFGTTLAQFFSVIFKPPKFG